VVVSAAFYNPHRGTCGCICINCNGYSNPAVLASPFTVAVRGNTQLHMHMTYYNGQVDDFTSSASWSSSNTSIATVGNGSTAGLTAGVSAGTMDMYASLAGIPTVTGEVCEPTAPSCSTSNPEGSAGGTSQVPTSVSIYSDKSVAEAKCAAGSTTGCGPERETVWQVMDQESPPKPIQAVMSSYDIISFSSTQNSFNLNADNFSTTCGTGDKFSTGPCNVFTNAQGQTITDVNTMCSTLCYSSGACAVPGSSPTTVYTQWWVIDGYKVAPHTYTMTCGKVLIDGK